MKEYGVHHGEPLDAASLLSGESEQPVKRSKFVTGMIALAVGVLVVALIGVTASTAGVINRYATGNISYLLFKCFISFKILRLIPLFLN